MPIPKYSLQFSYIINFCLDLVWMESGKFEGDMVLNQEQMLSVLGLGSKNGLIDKKYRWPKNEVPYVIVGGYFSK